MIGYGDRLQQHHAFRFQEFAAVFEVIFIIGMTNSFYHLDGNQFVIVASQVSVVFAEQGYPVVKAFFFYSLCSVFILLL